MKPIELKTGEYVSPESVLLEARFEGTLCTSTYKPDGQLEGYGQVDEFSW